MGVLGSIGSKTQHLIELATKLTIVGVPALYFAGWAYLDTYWAEFGVADELVGYTGADYIRSGSLVLVHSILESTTWVAIIVWVFVPILIILMCIRIFALPKMFGMARKARAWRSRVRQRGRLPLRRRGLARSLDALIDTAHAGVLGFLAAFLFVVGLIFIGVKPSTAKAKADAQQERTTLAAFATTERNWVLGYTENEDVRPALVMQCGSEMCVLLTSEKLEVIPRSAITRMETCRRIGKADDGAFHCITRTALL